MSNPFPSVGDNHARRALRHAMAQHRADHPSASARDPVRQEQMNATARHMRRAGAAPSSVRSMKKLGVEEPDWDALGVADPNIPTHSTVPLTESIPEETVPVEESAPVEEVSQQQAQQQAQSAAAEATEGAEGAEGIADVALL